MTERDAVDDVVELALAGLSPSLADKARHRAALGLGSTGAGSAGASAVMPGNGAGGWSALRSSGAAGWTAGALLLGAGVGLGFWLRGAVDQRAAPEQHLAVAPATASDTVPSALPRAAPSSRVEPAMESASASAPPIVARERTGARPERRATSNGAAGSADPTVQQPFDAELALLQRVERALRANNPSLALVLLDELDAGFAETRLGEERQAARRIAECRLQLPGGKQRAERFLSDQPGSVYAQRVRAACSSE